MHHGDVQEDTPLTRIKNGCGGQPRPLLRLRALETLGNKCVRCGFSDPRALQIDHINGGGSKEMKSKGNYKIYRDIVLGNLNGYQALCANCNWIKRHENNENGDYQK